MPTYLMCACSRTWTRMDMCPNRYGCGTAWGVVACTFCVVVVVVVVVVDGDADAAAAVAVVVVVHVYAGMLLMDAAGASQGADDGLWAVEPAGGCDGSTADATRRSHGGLQVLVAVASRGVISLHVHRRCAGHRKVRSRARSASSACLCVCSAATVPCAVALCWSPCR